MIRKGEVSSVDTVNRIARVTFIDLDNVVTAEIPFANHVSLNNNDKVAVAFFSDSLKDAVIIAVF